MTIRNAGEHTRPTESPHVSLCLRTLYVNSIGSLGVSKPVTSYNRLGKRERNHFPRGESYLAAWDSFGRLGQLREYRITIRAGLDACNGLARSTTTSPASLPTPPTLRRRTESPCRPGVAWASQTLSW